MTAISVLSNGLLLRGFSFIFRNISRSRHLLNDSISKEFRFVAGPVRGKATWSTNHSGKQSEFRNLQPLYGFIKIKFGGLLKSFNRRSILLLSKISPT